MYRSISNLVSNSLFLLFKYAISLLVTDSRSDQDLTYSVKKKKVIYYNQPHPENGHNQQADSQIGQLAELL